MVVVSITSHTDFNFAGVSKAAEIEKEHLALLIFGHNSLMASLLQSAPPLN
jgi:hypothetical protein